MKINEEINSLIHSGWWDKLQIPRIATFLYPLERDYEEDIQELM